MHENLGFVHAPALMQRIVVKLQNAAVDVKVYQKKRDLLCEGLTKADYKFAKPEGAFYLFVKSPIPDDVKFVKMLLKKNILVVPGSGFGGPGYFRIAYCVDDATIANSMKGFYPNFHGMQIMYRVAIVTWTLLYCDKEILKIMIKERSIMRKLIIAVVILMAVPVLAAQPQTEDQKILYALGAKVFDDLKKQLSIFNFSTEEYKFIIQGIDDASAGKLWLQIRRHTCRNLILWL